MEDNEVRDRMIHKVIKVELQVSELEWRVFKRACDYANNGPCASYLGNLSYAFSERAEALGPKGALEFIYNEEAQKMLSEEQRSPHTLIP